MMDLLTSRNSITMMKILILSFFLIFFSVRIKAQESYLNLIETGKLLKASQKITSALVKKPDDVILNFAMANLLMQRGYSGYDINRSYDYLTRSQLLYDNVIDQKELKELYKIPINTSIILSLNDSICRFALEDATKLNRLDAYESYLNYFALAPAYLKDEAKTKMNIVAYNEACDKNTVESYQNFITSYPGAVQQAVAKSKRNALAFGRTGSVNTIQAYQSFINAYPDATEVGEAWTRIHELAFRQAEKENTCAAYKQFIDEYPKSIQYSEAFKLYEKTQYFENTSPGNWKSNYLFAENYPKNSWISVALDSLFAYGVRVNDIKILKFCVDHMSGPKRNTALLYYHDAFTNDGERQTLDLFYSEYDEEILTAAKERDYKLSNSGDMIDLKSPYESKDLEKYIDYIVHAAPIEKAFVALQRIISDDVKNKNWKSAISVVKNYSVYFGNGNKKINDLIALLQAKWDNSIKIYPVGSGVNTKDGSEYVPVPSADGKYLYFCGRDRKDNLGGEDIFISTMRQGSWGTAIIIADLSYLLSNDAPLNISTDGNTMILFKSGDLYYSEKSSTGWFDEIAYPEKINSADWQADAMITSDGNTLLFTSVREGGYNTNTSESVYHGDYLHSCDIYASTLNELNQWSEPINLGPIINTRYCDRTPFLHPDMKTLYFSSDGHGGLGKLDVFKSTRLADTCWDCWSEPVNLGKEINTAESDWGYKISTDGEKAYFSKSLSVNGSYDIYWLNLPDHLRPDLVVTVSGTIMDTEKKPVSAEILWEDLETGQKVGQARSDPKDGTYFIVLPLGKMYGYYINKPGYYPISNNIDLRAFNHPKEIREDIVLVSYQEMIEDSISVPINNLFFNFDESTILPYSIPELKRLAEIIKSNNYKVEISGHTDSVGTDDYNQDLSEDRSAAVKTFLVNEGCQPDRLSTSGYGRSSPVESNETDAGRAKNRRVEIKIVN
jgi:outer membrane protein OmpA-like peptidoglycan-associated protein